MVLGVTRKGGRGVPKCIEQLDVTKKEDLAKARGTLKVSELVGDEQMKGLVAISLYDSKPVYLMTTASEEIVWVKKERKLFDKNLMELVPAPFFRINVIDDYNHIMGNVDIADQLRGSYRFDHWMRKRKWWWSMFFWCFQVLMTNSYIAYKKYMEIHDVKPMTHYQFRYRLCISWLDRKYRINITVSVARSIVSSLTSVGEIETRSRNAASKKPKRTQVSDTTLHPEDGKLKRRLEAGDHWPLPNVVKDPICQMHFWATQKKYRKQTMYCAKCGVTLCLICYKKFHTISHLVDMKAEIKCDYNSHLEDRTT